MEVVGVVLGRGGGKLLGVMLGGGGGLLDVIGKAYLVVWCDVQQKSLS